MGRPLPGAREFGLGWQPAKGVDWMRKPRILIVLAQLVMLPVVGAGCSRPGAVAGFDEYKRLQQTSLKPLGLLYGQFIEQNRGRAPATQEQFNKYLRRLPDGELQRLRVDGIESLFVSPRDGEPLAILYGKEVGRSGVTGMPWIAYEQKSTNGQRYVVNAIGLASVMEEEEFRDVFPNAH